MANQELERVRERETIPGASYERAYSRRAAFIELGKNGVVVIKESDRDWEIARQGHLKFYLLPWAYPETVLHNWYVFVHDVRKETGKHRHQGGLVLFVLSGQGATEVNGEVVEWEEGDCILLPLSPEGVEHVHFNRGETPAMWLAFIYRPMFDHVASELTQTKVSPQFQQMTGSR